MKRLATLALGLGLIVTTSLSAAMPDPPVVGHGPIAACHGYYATAHTGDFDVSVCRADDEEAIEEALTLVERISGDARYAEYVTVVYIP